MLPLQRRRGQACLTRGRGKPRPYELTHLGISLTDLLDVGGHEKLTWESSRSERFRALLRETPVYAVTDDALEPRELLRVLRSVVQAGVRLVQFRDKHRSDRERVEIGRQVRNIVGAAGGLLIVNDRADLAVALDADGVHLGQDDLPVEAARRLVGGDRLVGASASFLEEIPVAEAAGVDYLGFGAVYPTETKLDAEFAGLDLLEQACKLAQRPLIGIGGISTPRAPAVLRRGAAGVAVVSALFRASDPEAAARELLTRVRA